MTGSDPAPEGAPPLSQGEDAGEPDLDRLVAELHAEHGPGGPVSGAVRAAARAAYAARRDDAVMTELRTDSADTPAAGVRDSGALADAPRYLRFDTADTSVGVEVTADDDLRTLVGRIDPAGPTQVEIRTARGSAWSAVDDGGSFVAAAIPTGPISLVLHGSAAERPVATPWLTL
ncbi:hypothetical protein [Streptomonospora salina]|uniref:Uncharacterized protein n=1 Tax=Streptomonospora salina TaxID=104205 RepID=A0A841EJC1_9ACTN|nr:hypothetical protein [Streptomonospora salina]MBB6000450.1 hypothetical protein [Streptomonospora salina]